MFQTVDKALLFGAVLIGAFLVGTNAGGFATVIKEGSKATIGGIGTLQGRQVNYGGVSVGGLGNTAGSGGGGNPFSGSIPGVTIGNPFQGYTPPTFFY